MVGSSCSSSKHGPRSEVAESEDEDLNVVERVDLSMVDKLMRSAKLKTLKNDVGGSMYDAYARYFVTAKLLDGAVPVNYRLPANKLGRYKATIGMTSTHNRSSNAMYTPTLTTMKREVRSLLAADRYVDVDFVNCNPSIFKQVLDQYNISCPLLAQYVNDRERCIKEVSTLCNVDAKTSKELFIRITFLGSVDAWIKDHSVVDPPPQWTFEMRAEMDANARALLLRDELKPYLDSISPTSDLTTHAVSSAIAIFLQTKERQCLNALRDIVMRHGMECGALIYDGLHVAKSPSLSQSTERYLKIWSSHVICTTGFDLALTIKEFEIDETWLTPALDTIDEFDMVTDGQTTMPYDHTKEAWERHAFKVLMLGEFAVEDRKGVSMFSRNKLIDAFQHIKYTSVVKGRNNTDTLKELPFIKTWLEDKNIKKYRYIDMYPPPMECPPDTYNMWSGFDVSKYDPQGRAVDTGSEGVNAFIKHLSILLHEKEESLSYVLDWLAQLFQQPSKKIGIALLLKGAEGVGKNRFTDLLHLMLGSSHFLETARPGQVLFGRFTDTRKNKFLMVINESNGGDNHPANDQLKDMITSPTFVWEAKGRDAMTLNSFDRFIFTTNNDNCLKVNPDSRRYVIFEVSSALKGNSEYFRQLSHFIDDPHCRFEFYQLLMERDISRAEWINNRPISSFYPQMVEMNLPKEYEFVRDGILMPEYAKGPDRTVQLDAATLFDRFLEWLCRSSSSATYNTNTTKFGVKISSLCNEESSENLDGCFKERRTCGILYTFKVDIAVNAMFKRMWFGNDALPLRDMAIGVDV